MIDLFINMKKLMKKKMKNALIVRSYILDNLDDILENFGHKMFSYSVLQIV